MKPSPGHVDNRRFFEKPKILLVAPRENLAAPFKAALEENGFAAMVADFPSEHSRAPHTESFALVINLSPNGRNGAADFTSDSPTIDALFLVGHQTPAGTVEAFQNGVYRFGADHAEVDKFVATVRELLQGQNTSFQRNQKRATHDQRPVTSDQPPELALIGQSPQIENVRQLVKRISQFPGVPVLITGETGTGKEVVANLLHTSSSRAEKPFIPVNCGAIPEALCESEFFGHCKGAFTGAHVAQKGLVEAAQDGTLFLDEISTLTLAQQVKLLRFLQDGRYTRVGETQERQSDVTVIAATNEELKVLVAAGRFREDLYHRLNVAEIILAPLRKRGGDILLLAEHFLRTCPHGRSAQPKKLARKSQALLLQYHYPGNVRELQNIIEKAIIAVGSSTIICPEHLPLQLAEASGYGAENNKIKTLREMEREHILTVYKNCGGKIKKTAQQLDVAPNTLRKKLDAYGIRL